MTVWLFHPAQQHKFFVALGFLCPGLVAVGLPTVNGCYPVPNFTAFLGSVGFQRFADGDTVTLETLLEKKIVRKPYDGLKVLANGELTKKLTVKAAKFTAAAKEKITAAGGQAEEV